MKDTGTQPSNQQNTDCLYSISSKETRLEIERFNTNQILKSSN